MTDQDHTESPGLQELRALLRRLTDRATEARKAANGAHAALPFIAKLERFPHNVNAADVDAAASALEGDARTAFLEGYAAALRFSKGELVAARKEAEATVAGELAIAAYLFDDVAPTLATALDILDAEAAEREEAAIPDVPYDIEPDPSGRRAFIGLAPSGDEGSPAE